MYGTEPKHIQCTFSHLILCFLLLLCLFSVHDGSFCCMRNNKSVQRTECNVLRVCFGVAEKIVRFLLPLGFGSCSLLYYVIWLVQKGKFCFIGTPLVLKAYFFVVLTGLNLKLMSFWLITSMTFSSSHPSALWLAVLSGFFSFFFRRGSFEPIT